MSFTNKVDYLPNMQRPGDDVQLAMDAAKKTQQQRWQILFTSFLLVAVLANIYVWSRPALFKSEALIHFSSSAQSNLETSEIAQQELALNQHRLNSNSTLQAVSLALLEKQINLSTEQLAQIMRAEARNSGRLISLKAVGHDPLILKPILDSWLSYYLALTSNENVSNNSEEIQQYSQQISVLEEKITQQQALLDDFSQSHNIISLNRDENRVLNKIKGLGASLDAAESQEAEALALLESIKTSIENGQLIERAADKAGIDAKKTRLQTLKGELSALSDKYTQDYLQRDPVVVAKQEAVIALAEEIEQHIAQSQELYLQESQRKAAAAKGKSIALRKQLGDLQQQALIFNQKMEQYRRLEESLKELRQQAQGLKNQQVKLEVSKPFFAKMEILEKPFTPEFSFAPNYWRDTIISLAVALLVSLFVLLLFSFIVRQKETPRGTSNFVVIPGQQYLDHQGNPLVNQPAALGQAAQTLRLNQTNTASNTLRLLSFEDCQRLYKVANEQGKMVIGLLLSGLSVEELADINQDDFSREDGHLNVRGSCARKIELHENLQIIAGKIFAKSPDSSLLWSTPLSPEDFTQLIINAAHDAELPFPEQLSMDVIRHTYITFLVNQGVRLNDLEQFAGYIIPTELAHYRQVNRHGKAVEPGGVNTVFPFCAAIT